MIRAKTALLVSLGLSGLVALSLMVAGCGGSGAPPGTVVQDGAATGLSDAPAVTVGGYTFGTNSNRLNHPFFKATPTTANWVYSGRGTCQGQVRTCLFSDGGLVAGVKTVGFRMWDVGPEQPPGGDRVDVWMAQDTQGNIHGLKYQGTRANGHRQPTQLTGVAAGGPPAFWLPRAGQLTLNHTWTWTMSGKVVHQWKITNLNGRIGGKSGLLVVRGISDQNGDGTFNPSWTGPDDRDDNWFQPAVGPWYWQWNSNGGLLRQ